MAKECAEAGGLDESPAKSHGNGDNARTPGIPMCEVWPEAREAALESIALAKRSRQDERRFGQCRPAY